MAVEGFTTLVLAAPKIGPVAEKLRERIADLLSIEPGAVGIKAKTPEGLNQDDVAVAHAIVLLEKFDDDSLLEKMAATSEPDVREVQMDDVVRKLVGRTTATSRRKPAFNTDDIS